MQKGLPRIRGDRPLPEEVWKNIDTATPHTRGSTQGVIGMIAFDEGYPAYAGIDPLCPGR